MQPVDLTGQVFGRWTVVGTRHVRRSIRLGDVDVHCGSEKWVVSQTLRNGSSRSCGCLLREETAKRFLKNLVGKRFDRLTVLKQRKAKIVLIRGYANVTAVKLSGSARLGCGKVRLSRAVV